MPAFAPLTTLDHAAAQLARGATSAAQLAETALARACEGEGPKTYTRVLPGSALAEARASDTLRAAGLAAILALILGVSCFRNDVIESVAILGIWVGISWIFSGVTSHTIAITDDGPVVLTSRPAVS